MREFLIMLRKSLSEVCPTFLQIPSQTPYPYITISPGRSLQGLPWGPRVLLLTIKIWSQYTGTQEILRLTKELENLIQEYNFRPFEGSLKIVESGLILLKDKQTRVHTFLLKVRFQGRPYE